jgi:ABC-type iron transport system FetAB permease component
MWAMNVSPVYTARHFIPVIGMQIGNAMGAVAVSLNQCLDQIQKGKEEVELYLACGATRWEATQEIVKEATKNGLLPTLNSMRQVRCEKTWDARHAESIVSVTGLINIPGMLAGQILSGAPTGGNSLDYLLHIEPNFGGRRYPVSRNYNVHGMFN